MNSWTLSNGLWLGADVDDIVDWFLEHQLDDGGWNCEWVEGATVSSFHSTLNSLIGLLDHQLATGDADRVRAARHCGEEYVLSRGLVPKALDRETLQRLDVEPRTSAPRLLSVLAAADNFRTAAIADGTSPDPRRVGDRAHPRATTAKRQLAPRPPATRKSLVPHGRPTGEPSKWVTHKAIRVFDWWDAQA